MSHAGRLLLILSGAITACGPPRGGPQAVDPVAAIPSNAPTTVAAGATPAPMLVELVAPAPGPIANAITAPAFPAPPPELVAAAPDEDRIPDDEASRALLEQLRADSDATRRRAAIDRWTDSPRPLAPLIEAVFKDKDPLVRRWAALAIDRKARAEHAPAILQASRSEPDPTVRRILLETAARFPL